MKAEGIKLTEFNADRVPLGGGAGAGLGPAGFNAFFNAPFTPRASELLDKTVPATTFQHEMRYAHTLQPFYKTLRESGDPSLFDKTTPGGILFDRRSIYLLDVSGAVCAQARKAVDAAHHGDGSFTVDGKRMVAAGFRIGGQGSGTSQARSLATRLAGEITLLQLESPLAREGSLPFGVARFLASPGNGVSCFGGPWTFEPIVAVRPHSPRVADSPNEPNVGVTVIPAETGERLPYAPEEQTRSNQGGAKADKASSVGLAKKNSRFQPTLVANADGTYSWMLRHGLCVRLDGQGLVQCIREPDGHSVVYARDRHSRLIAKETSDRTRIQIDYASAQPASLSVADNQTPIRYSYVDGFLRSVVGGSRELSIGYEGNWVRSLTWDTGELTLAHDPQGRLTSVTADKMGIGVEYVRERNAIRITNGSKTVDWRIGPRGDLIGVVLGNEAILWTRSVEGRIIQVAFGHLQDEAGKTTKKFIVDDTIGTAPKL
jgi:YD repeat-containing protein